jgi:hypothetical protein
LYGIKHWKDERYKKLMHYRMSFDIFNNLVEESTTFLKSMCINPMSPQLEIQKVVVILF